MGVCGQRHHRHVCDSAEAADPGVRDTCRSAARGIFEEWHCDTAEVAGLLDLPVQAVTAQAFHDCRVRHTESGMQPCQVAPGSTVREAMPTSSAARMSDLSDLPSSTNGSGPQRESGFPGFIGRSTGRTYCMRGWQSVMYSGSHSARTFRERPVQLVGVSSLFQSGDSDAASPIAHSSSAQ